MSTIVMRRYLTEAEQASLLAEVGKYAAAIARRDSAWMRLLQSSGLRIGEFSLMTVGDADLALAAGYIFVPKEHRKGGKRDHSARVTEPVKKALLDLLSIRAEMGFENAPNAPLVMSRKGGAMTVRAFQKRFELWVAKAGLAVRASPHWMRHTRAMNIMRRTTSNDPRGIVQAALGHASIGSTGIYTATSREALEAALDEVDGKKPIRKRDMRRVYEEQAHV